MQHGRAACYRQDNGHLLGRVVLAVYIRAQWPIDGNRGYTHAPLCPSIAQLDVCIPETVWVYPTPVQQRLIAWDYWLATKMALPVARTFVAVTRACAVMAWMAECNYLMAMLFALLINSWRSLTLFRLLILWLDNGNHLKSKNKKSLLQTGLLSPGPRVTWEVQHNSAHFGLPCKSRFVVSQVYQGIVCM